MICKLVLLPFVFDFCFVSINRLIANQKENESIILFTASKLNSCVLCDDVMCVFSFIVLP